MSDHTEGPGLLCSPTFYLLGACSCACWIALGVLVWRAIP